MIISYLCSMEWQIVRLGETDSTNRWLREHGTGNMVAMADFQTAGRGCGTNSWESEPGMNLLFSVLLHPEHVPAADQFVLSMANALALHEVLSAYSSGMTIKWPNDLYWRDQKIGGTLIETTLVGSHIKDCIIGTGINVNQTEFLSDAPNPVSLRQILGREVMIDELLRQVVECISKWMQKVEEGSWHEVRTNYRRHLYRRGEQYDFRLADSKVERCLLQDVTDDGHLQLLTSAGCVLRLGFKEVSFII
ncbi:MAG: biotin--[acetyl-CoA-carboxylase] ligase [Prevotella sp.]|nr:biotin--[acetyl-CoA-carboxylase] ligase [Prevotella sp.]